MGMYSFERGQDMAATKPATPSILGMPGAKKRMPWYVKVGAFVALGLVGLVLSGDIGTFLVFGGAGAYVIWSWMREKGNVVDSVMNWIFILGLLATSLRGGILTASDGVRSTGPAVKDAIVNSVKEKVGQYPTAVPPVDAATTTTVPGTP